MLIVSAVAVFALIGWDRSATRLEALERALSTIESERMRAAAPAATSISPRGSQPPQLRYRVVDAPAVSPRKPIDYRQVLAYVRDHPGVSTREAARVCGDNH
jgi:hypothetical protein